ncbi:fibronectin type III domain-containing protein, partial [Bacteroidota bacterium]
VAKEITSYEVTGLENGTEYTFTIKTVDVNNNKSIGTTINSTPVDVTAAQDVTNLTTTAGDNKVVLNWTEPTDVDFVKVEISYSPGSSSLIFVNKGTETYTIDGLTNGSEYSFTIKSVDDDDNLSEGISVNATPVDIVAPQEVSNISVFEGEEYVILNWTDPIDTDYEMVEITYSPGTQDPIYANKGTSEYTIENLSIGTEYTFNFKSIDDDENISTGISISATPDYEIEGTYTAIEGEYWRNEMLMSTVEYWLDEFQIEKINETTYKLIKFCAWENNELYFQIGESGQITYPVEWGGVNQTLNDEPITTCDLNPADLEHVDCENSNFATIDELNYKHKLTMTIGYYTEGSGPREFYQVLEKL